MKKLFLLLIFLFSNIFATTFDTWVSGACPITYHYGGYFFYDATNIQNNASLDDKTFVDEDSSANTHYLYTPSSSNAYCVNIFDNYTNDDTNNANMLFYSHKVSDSCPEGQVFDDSTLSCIVPPPDCPSGYKPDPNNSEQCIPDCSQNVPSTSPAPLGYVKYSNEYNSSQACQYQSEHDSHLYNDFAFSDTTDSRGCYYSVCYINEYDPEPCINQNSVSEHKPVGYIFKGIASSDTICSSMVDGVYYLNYQTYNVYNNCATDNSVYCYLKPGLDNNTSGVDINESNQTYSDGTIPNTNIPPIDTNDSNINNYDFNSTSNSNVHLGELTADLKNFISEYKKSDSFWRIDNTNKFNSRTINDNLNTDKVVNATNNLNSGISSMSSKIDTTNNKLDTLIGDTTDTSGQVLGDIANIHLTDFNTSFIDDSNFSHSYSSQELQDMVSADYVDFSDKATNAILSAFNNIDYGVLDFFAVSSYDFQDYSISQLHIGSAVFTGKLMDANFLNSLPWGYMKLALLLATLLGGVIYILDRLF